MNLIKLDHHRNGVSGSPFTVGIVKEQIENKECILLIIQFDNDELNTAVFDLDMIKNNVIEFGVNSWRGDHYSSKFKIISDIELKKQSKKLMGD